MDGQARIELTRRDGVARLRLAAPARRNAVDLEWCREFAAAATTCAADDSVRVVLIDAAGDWFSVGGDIDYFIAHREELRTTVYEMTALFHAGIMRFHRGNAPVVAAVNGMAAGGGFSLACGADLILAKRSAKMVSAYSSSGLSPDGGLTYFLPRIVGIRTAFEMIALNRVLTADDAQRLGLVTRVIDDSAFTAEVEATITALLKIPRGALAGVKRLLANSLTNSLPQQLDQESMQIADLASSPETQAVLDQFLARRARST